MYRVIIIEDDPMVADINRRYLERDADFSVEGIFKNGIPALEYLVKKNPVDLVLLDYYTPQMTGGEFLERLHNMESFPSVIMVTSANDADIVGRLLARGVVDYLVKPFEYSRFKAALERFKKHHAMLADRENQELGQDEIDRLLAAGQPAAPETELAKGLNEATLQKVRRVLRQHAGDMFTAEQLAERVGLSRITIRRYVGYMVETHQIASAIDYQTGGRPSILYFFPKD